MATDNPIDRAQADIADLQKRINGLEAEQNRLENQLSLLYSERNRITAYIELSKKYGAQPSEADQASKQSNGSAEESAALRSARPYTRKGRRARGKVERKPHGMPSTSTVIREAIRDARNRGKAGAEPADILAFIRARYWPGAKSANVSPVAWRMWQDGLLTKDERGIYAEAKGVH